VPPVNGANPKTEDRADIGLARIGNNVILDRARGFHRLHDEKTLLQLLDIKRIGIEMFWLQTAQRRPQALLALPFFGIS